MAMLAPTESCVRYALTQDMLFNHIVFEFHSKCIREYGSTLYVGMARKKHGRPCMQVMSNLASQPLRLWRKGQVNCQRATCNSLQESCRLQENSLIIFMEHKMAYKRVENSLIIFMEHKMAYKRVEMLFAKKLFVLKL